MLRAAEASLGADRVLGPARSDGGSSEGVWAAWGLSGIEVGVSGCHWEQLVRRLPRPRAFSPAFFGGWLGASFAPESQLPEAPQGRLS